MKGHMPAAKGLRPSSLGSAGCQCRKRQQRALPGGLRLQAACAALGAWHASPRNAPAQPARHPHQEIWEVLSLLS